MKANPELVGMVCVVLACTAFGPDTAAVDAGRAVRSVASISESLKVPFIANQGQHDQSVRFYARTFGGTVFVTNDIEIVYSLPGSSGAETRGGVALREYLIGCRVNEIAGSKPASTAISWFKGSDRTKWKSHLATFEYVDLGEVYNGVNLNLRAYGNNVEKLFIVDPGADVGQIRIGIDGADGLSVNEGGELEIMAALGEVKFTKPVAYQNYSGAREYVRVAYVLTDTWYGFTVGDYDKTRPLIIDPLLASTFLGGSAEEGWTYTGMIDNAVADDGSVLVAGMTVSTDFPTQAGCYECTSCGGHDIFIARFNPDLSALLSVAIIGGSADDHSPRIRVHDGEIYLAGATYSSDFPTTPGCFSGSYGGSGDVIVSKFDTELTTLLASTYIGSPAFDGYCPSLAVDNPANVFVSSNTSDGTFPTSAGAFSQSIAGLNDCFVARLSSDLTTLTAGTFVGGQYDEKGGVIAITSGGHVVLATASESDDYPTTAGAYERDFHGPPQPGEYIHDVVISIFDNDLDSLIASTYVGSSNYEGASMLVVSDNGSIYVAGHTTSPSYPVSEGVFDTVHNGINETFITRMSGDLATLEASTFLTPGLIGRQGFVFHDNMILDVSGRVVMVGDSEDGFAPCTPDAHDPTYNGGRDFHVIVLSDDLREMKYATYLGGTGDEQDAVVTRDENGNIYLAMYTSSTDFPMVGSSWQPVYGGGTGDCIVARLTYNQFTRIIEGPHVNDGKGSDGGCWIDYDDDGFLDIYVPNNALLGPENNSLYRNNGDGTYTEITGLSIVNDSTRTGKATWADYDNDGDMDLIWTVLEYTEVGILCENTGGSFAQVIPSPFSDVSVLSTSISWTDYDVDNLLDIFIGNAYGLGGPSRDFLYKGNGETFTEITTGPLVTRQKYTYCASWSDYDNDMLPDLVSPGNVEFLTELYHNDGGGLFTYDAASDVCQSIASGAGASWADYDNDGDMDLFMGTAAPGSAYLYQSDGEGALTEVIGHGLEMSFGRIYGGSWADYDNDGDEDIVIWSNIYSYPDPDYDSGLAFMYENVDGSFYRQSDTLMFFGDRIIKAIIWGDSDRDGDLDLYAPMAELYSEGADNVFYENNGNSNNWITIKPIGTVSNRSAIGAKVRLRSNIGGSLTWQMRELTSMVGTGWQPPLEAHFGLGDATIIDSIKIEWPSGAIQILTDVTPNQFLTIEEDCCSGLTGNVDYDPDDIVDIGDLTALIDYLFISYEEPFCMAE
ncbi:MAG: VCBS repeat-containing protein, partial [Candidatus Zixiibacteriota bacterium]